jgi:iron complex transport system substrate-binding protein
LLCTAFACEREVPATAVSTPKKAPTVASLVPAATDLIVGMGAADHLVAVSNYDVERDGTRGLPRVGDYQTVDWERLRALRPDYLFTFHSPERVPPGVREKADELGIKLVNVRTETLDDLFVEMGKLGEMIREKGKATEAADGLRAELEAVKTSVAGKARVQTLIVRDEKGNGVVGRGTFLDDLLEIAGGTNVVELNGWPSVDHEMIKAYRPDAIIVLLSDAPAQVEAEARRVIGTMTEVPAVKNGRVCVINAWHTQLASTHVAELARRMAGCLHPDAVRAPTTQGRP